MIEEVTNKSDNLAKNPYFDTVNKNGWFGIEYKCRTVGVLPYTVDSSGLLENIGLMTSKNPMRISGEITTLLTETPNNNDGSILKTAIRGLKEESGFIVEDEDLWTYLGTFNLDIDSNRSIPVFAVNITEIPDERKETDEGTFKIFKSSNVTAINEAIVLASFFRLFNYFYRIKQLKD